MVVEDVDITTQNIRGQNDRQVVVEINLSNHTKMEASINTMEVTAPTDTKVTPMTNMEWR